MARPRKPAAKKQKAKTKKTVIESASIPETTAPKRGRPSAYTPELGDLICRLLSQGKTLTSICKADDSLPAHNTVLGWALDNEHPFFDQYARARLIGYHTMADETLDVADEASSDWIDTQDSDGKPAQKFNAEAVARSRLRVDTRKWLLSKCLPKIYGDKIALTDPDGGTLKVEFVR